MSITFNVEGATHETVECPKCGAKYPETLDNDCQETMEGSIYGACYGMGFTLSDSPEMNLSGSNAMALLRLVGHDSDDECGWLDPADVLRHLAVLESDPSVLVTKNEDNHGIHIDENGVRSVARCLSIGRSYDQVERYIVRLKRIAEIAMEKGVRISFG